MQFPPPHVVDRFGLAAAGYCLVSHARGAVESAYP
jgi:hypothetical protein